MKYLCFLMLGLAMTGCNLKEKYARNNSAADAWIGQHTASAKTSVTGQWKSDAWGKASFTQTGRHVTGTLGEYSVKGVVSGRTAYLTAKEDGWVFYTIQLKKTSAWSLEGTASDNIPFTADGEKDVTLHRIEQ